MAEAVEALESCQTSTCSSLDSEPTSDMTNHKISGDVDSWCELPQLIELRTKLRTEINNTETHALTLEQEICENRVSKVEKTLCEACGFVREPRQRKIAELRLMHQAMLKSKPKHLLCTAGIITRFETMILEGFLDCGSTNKATRCCHCRQESNEATMKRYLVAEFLDILKHHLDNCTNTENCSMTEACSNCLRFMQLCLTQPEKFMTVYLGSKKDNTQNSNVPDKPEDEPVLDQELSNVAAKPSDESSLKLDQDVVYAETESKKILATMQSEFSDYEKYLTNHLDSFNTIHDQLLDHRLQEKKCLEHKEAHLYMTVQVLLEDSFDGHQGNDLFDPDKANFRQFRVCKEMKLHELMEMLADSMKRPLEQLRPWPFCFRSNQTCRPALIDMESEAHDPIIDVAENANPWNIFLETVMPDSGMVALPLFDKDSDVLLFFKLYDARNKRIQYCGHHYMPVDLKVQDLIPILNERAGFPLDTELLLYEEVKPNMVDRIQNLHDTHNQLKGLDELMDGDIIVFQKDESEEGFEQHTCEDYFRDLFYRVEVTFCDKTIPKDPGFTMVLYHRINYNQMASAVAERLGTDPYLLQFFKSLNYKDSPGHLLRCTYDGSLKDLLVYSKPKEPKKVYYQQLSIPIYELENKRQFKCVWMSPNGKEEELILFPNKRGTVADLLEEACKQVEFAENGTWQLRLFEQSCYKIIYSPSDECPLEQINTTSDKTYRIEEVPHDEVILAKDEILVPVAHFSKDVYATFGTPIVVKVKHGENFPKVKQRIQKKLGLPEKEFERIKFTVVVKNKAIYIDDDSDYIFSADDFKFPLYQALVNFPPRPWIGLDHVNKATKRS